MVSQLNLGTECTFLSCSSAVMSVGLHQSSFWYQVFGKHFNGGWYLLRLVCINISASETGSILSRVEKVGSPHPNQFYNPHETALTVSSVRIV